MAEDGAVEITQNLLSIEATTQECPQKVWETAGPSAPVINSIKKKNEWSRELCSSLRRQSYLIVPQ